MLSCMVEQGDRARSDASLVSVEELSGWASVAEALLAMCARTALVEAEEPTARARLVVESADSLAAIVQAHVIGVAALQRRAAAMEDQRSDALAQQLRASHQECQAMNGDLVSQRASCSALEEELHRLSNELQLAQHERGVLQEERKAVWCAVQEAQAVVGITCPAEATIGEHVGALCAWVKKAETAAPSLVAVAPHHPARLSYNRILPATPVNPVTASLLRVKEQVEQMREPSQEKLKMTVGMSRPWRDKATTPQTPSPRARAVMATATATVSTPTPLTVDRSLGRFRFSTPHRSTGGSATQREDDAAASPPWLTHMMKLQKELKDLRRDLGPISSSP
ncbi:hypothetical protein JKF63_07211 [Porcisia hertigi]|uniref:Uncharacterized protein n=1 Tax=Porcisia hertigi TaxID=2761500 RepID=A0A836LL62_9TRYP|nr:hypothetical protein JKF63_07211 [Porcisia hertigi]